MAGTLISFPAEEASDWTAHIDMFKDLIIGYIRCSLTEWDTGTVPQLAAGSKVELNGSYITFGSNESITGTPSSGYINYIYLDSAAYTLSWSTTPPTWSDAKQGWYNGSDRCLGGCYYDGTYYTNKWIYTSSIDARILNTGVEFKTAITRYYAISFGVGITAPSANVNVYGTYVSFDANNTVFFPVNLPHGAIVTELYAYLALSDGTLTLTLCRSALAEYNDESVMASCAGNGAQTDSSISNAIIDNDTYTYYAKVVRASHSTGAHIRGAKITYTILAPLP